ERVRGLQSALRISRPEGGDAAMRVDTRLDGRSTAMPSADLYRAIVSEMLARNPPPSGERLAWPPPPERLAAVLPVVFDELREREQPHGLGGGWAIPVTVSTSWGEDHLTRARVARNLIGALGVEEAMYPTAEVDA